MHEQPQDWAVLGDVVESAPPPRRPGLRRAVLVTAAVLALVAWLVLRARHESAHPEPMPAVTAPTTGLDLLPQSIGGWDLVPGLDLGTVLVPTSPPWVVDTWTAESRFVSGLPAVPDWTYDATDLGDARFLLVARSAGQPAQAFLVVGASATLVVSGDDIVPGADGGSVLVSQDRGTEGWGIQRYDLTGAPVGDPWTVAPDAYLVAETIDGQVIVDRRDSQWRVRDPDTGEIRDLPGEVVAVGRRTLAYRGTDGRLVVGTLSGGAAPASAAQYPPPPPASGLVHLAVLSPDQRYLALDLVGPYPVEHTVLVLDTTTATWSTLPGTPLRQDLPATLTWVGGVLVYGLAGGVGVLWVPGDPVPYVATSPR